MKKIKVTFECEIDDVDLLLTLYEIIHYNNASSEEKERHRWSGASQEMCDNLLFLVARHAPLILGEREGDIEVALRYIKEELENVLAQD